MLKIKALKDEKGQLVYGVIDDSVSANGNNKSKRTKIDFQYKSIDEFMYETMHNGYKYYSPEYYMCRKFDGGYDFYKKNSDHAVEHLIDNNSGYEILDCLGYNKFIARKNGKVGIIEIDTPIKTKTKGNGRIHSEYKFGKASEIIKEDDGRVKLIKHQKDGDDLIGFYNDDKFGTIDPEYLSIEKWQPTRYYKDEAKNIDAQANLLMLSKKVNGEIVFGVKQLVLDNGERKLEDFIPIEYSSIVFCNDNIIRLSQKVDGKEKYGFMCYTINWHIRDSYIQRARVEFVPLLNQKCEYDEIEFKYPHNYYSCYNRLEGEFRLINGNKEKLLHIEFSKHHNKGYIDKDYEAPFSKFLGNGKYYLSTCKVWEGMYLAERHNGCDILTTRWDYNSKKSKDINYITIPGNYAKLEGYNGLMATLKNGNKQLITYEKKEEGVYIYHQSEIWKKVSYVTKDGLSTETPNYADYPILAENVYGSKKFYTKEGKLIQENVRNVRFVKDDDYKRLHRPGFYEVYDFGENKTIYDSDYNYMLKCRDNASVSMINAPARVFKVVDSENNIYLKINKTPDGWSKQEQEESEEKYATFKMVMEGHKFKQFDIYKRDYAPDSSEFDDDNNEEYSRIYDCIIEYEDGSTLRKLVNIDFLKGRVNYICTGNFKLEGMSNDKNRSILSVINEEGMREYGVIENTKGGIIIPFDNSEIIYNNYTNTYKCTNFNDEVTTFDEDGFVVVNEEEKTDVKVKQKTDKKN